MADLVHRAQPSANLPIRPAFAITCCTVVATDAWSVTSIWIRSMFKSVPPAPPRPRSGFRKGPEGVRRRLPAPASACIAASDRADAKTLHPRCRNHARRASKSERRGREGEGERAGRERAMGQRRDSVDRHDLDAATSERVRGNGIRFTSRPRIVQVGTVAGRTFWKATHRALPMPPSEQPVTSTTGAFVAAIL